MNLAKHFERLFASLAVLLGILLKEQGSKTQPEALNLLNLNIEITRSGLAIEHLHSHLLSHPALQEPQ